MDRFSLTAQLLLKPTGIPAAVRSVRDAFKDMNVNVKVRTDANALKGIENDLKRLQQQARKSSGLFSEMGSILANAARRFAGISIATGTFLGLARAIKGGIGDAIKFEREIAKIAQATETSISSVNRLGQEVSDISKKYGTASNELIKFGRIFAQAGFSISETRNALILLAKTDLAGTFGDMVSTSETMITLLNVFGKDAQKAGASAKFFEQSIDSINRISKKYAVEAEDLGVAIQKTGAVFESAGGNLHELNALFTSVRATTRESADTIANGFKTIFTRLQKQDSIDALKQLGVELEDVNGKFIGPYEAIQKIGMALEALPQGSTRKSNILAELGGGYQIGRLIPLVKNYAMQQQILNESKAASGDLNKDVAISEKTLEAQINRTKEAFASLIREFTATSEFRVVVEGALSFANAAIKITEALRPLLPLLAAYVALVATKTAFSFGKAFIGGGAKPSKMHMTQVGGHATGGIIQGKPGIDTNPAMLTKGEFVVNAKDAKENYGILSAINSGHKVGHFARGTNRTSMHGTIPDVSGATPNYLHAKNSAYDSVGLPDTRKMEKATESVTEAYIKQKKMLEDAIASEKKMADVEFGLVSEMDVFKRAIIKIRSQIDGGKINPLLLGDIVASHSSRKSSKTTSVPGKPVNDLSNMKMSSAEAKALSSAGGAKLSEKTEEVASHFDKLSLILPAVVSLLFGVVDSLSWFDDSTKKAAQSAIGMGTMLFVLSKAAIPTLVDVISNGSTIMSGFFKKSIADAATSVNVLSKSSKVAAAANVAEAASESAVTKSSMGLSMGINLAVVGFSLLVAGIQYFSSKATQAADDLLSSIGKDISNFSESGKWGSESIESKMQKAHRLQNSSSGMWSGAISGGLTGIVAGAITGALGGPLGILGGAAVGGIAGAAGGAAFGSEDDELSNNQVKDIKNTSAAMIGAAEAAYEFSKGVKSANEANLSSAEIYNRLSDAAKASSEKGAIVRKSFGAMRDDPRFKKGGNATKAELDLYDKAESANSDLSRVQSEITNKLSEAMFNDIADKVKKATSAKEIEDIYNSQDVAGKKNTVSESFKDSKGYMNDFLRENSAEVLDHAKAQNEALDRSKKANIEQFNIIDASNNARRLELEIIQRTNTALKGLMQSTLDVDNAQSSLDIARGGAGGIASGRFKDISKVGNLVDFERDAQATGSEMGPAGASFANEIVSAARAIDTLRGAIIDKELNNLGTSKFDDVNSKKSIREYLTSKSSDFAGMNKSVQDKAVEDLYGQLSTGNISADGIDKFIKGIQDSAQYSGEVLDQVVEIGKKQIQTMSQANEMMIEFRARLGDLNSGLLEVNQNGVNRLFEVNREGMTNADVAGHNRAKEANRLNMADALLGSAGVSSNRNDDIIAATAANEDMIKQRDFLKAKLDANPNVNNFYDRERINIRGRHGQWNPFTKVTRTSRKEIEDKIRQLESGVGGMGGGSIDKQAKFKASLGATTNLGGRGVAMQKKLLANRAELDNKYIPNDKRGKLLKENQGLENAIKKTTQELTRLANQSERAADIMGEIEQAKAGRDLIKSKATDFVTGGMEDRQSILEQFAGLQELMRTGSFETLPEDLRKSVNGLVDELAKADPNGQAVKARDAAIARDMQNFGAMNGVQIDPKILDILMGGKTDKEKDLIDSLKILNEEEKAAQQALIAIESENQQVMSNLLMGVNNLVNSIQNNLGVRQIGLAPPINQQMNVGITNNLKTTLESTIGVIPESVNSLTTSMNTVTTSLNGIAQSLSNITMKHEISIDGQLNIAGFNSENITAAFKDSINDWMVGMVKDVVNKQNQAFRTA